MYHTGTENNKLSNSLFLMGCFMIAVLKINTDKVVKVFNEVISKTIPFRDASYGDCHYQCTLEHCWQGLEYAQ